MKLFITEPLADHHELDAFTSGKELLDGWLRHESRRAVHSGTAKTHVWTTPGSAEIDAYFSIAPTSVLRADIGKHHAGGVSPIPAFLLARLALGKQWQGQGLGEQLLMDALELIAAAAQVASGRLIVVGPIDAEAEGFYRHYGFLPTHDRRLVMKVSTAAAALRG